MAAKKKSVAPVKPEGGIEFYVSPTYQEIPNGDGVMRADEGDYVVTTEDGTVIMPPSRFAEVYPDLAD